MGALPSTLKDSDFVSVGGSVKDASDLFRVWAERTAGVERSLELRMMAINVQLAFAVMSNFLHTRDDRQYKAMRLYIDIAERDVENIKRDEKVAASIKTSFASAAKYLQIRAGVIDKRIAETREADMLVAYKKIAVKEAIEDAKLLEARIAELHARVAALKKRGGAYRFPRRYSRKFCRRTTCRRMGFTQKASCRPYKNCYRRTRRSVSARGL
jgi:hypothetical protein